MHKCRVTEECFSILVMKPMKPEIFGFRQLSETMQAPLPGNPAGALQFVKKEHFDKLERSNPEE